MPPAETSSPSGPVCPAAGIPGLAMYPHDHICAFVARPGEADDLIALYLRDGLGAGQPCLYVAAPARRSAVLAMLDAVGAAIHRDPLEIVDLESVFARTGTFDLDASFEFWDAWVGGIAGRTNRTARIAVDMSAAHPPIEPSFVRHLVSYETRFTTWVRLHPLVSLSVYHLDEFGVGTLLPLVRSQPTVWLGGVVVDNPYHVDPVDPVAVDRGNTTATAAVADIGKDFRRRA